MAVASTLQTSVALGPLKVHQSNHRYFTDGSGKVIYLTGSHHWNNFQDGGNPFSHSTHFDYMRYLDFLQQHNHNFMRLWVRQQATWTLWSTEKIVFDPLLYLRTGPGTALDGELRFDLNQFNQVYFDRLRERVVAARARGIYVGIILFAGASVGSGGGNPWRGHPFNKANNINGIDGDPEGSSDGLQIYTLQIPAITSLQEAYVRKVIDSVNDLDNVLYEIGNEIPIESKNWQYHLVNYIKKYEASNPKQHPIGITYFANGRKGAMDALYASPADWISPGNDLNPVTNRFTFRYDVDPPISDGRKVIVSDTDHFFGIGGDQSWVWKSFTRGLNPIFMDPDPLHDSSWESTRRAMGHTLTYANWMDLTAMVPRNDLCSTAYCLANPGFEYLIYLPFGAHWLEPWIELMPYRIESWVKSMDLFSRTAIVNLSAALGTLSVEWFNPTTGETVAGGTTTGGSSRSFTSPFGGDAVLYIRLQP